MDASSFISLDTSNGSFGGDFASTGYSPCMFVIPYCDYFYIIFIDGNMPSIGSPFNFGSAHQFGSALRPFANQGFSMMSPQLGYASRKFFIWYLK